MFFIYKPTVTINSIRGKKLKDGWIYGQIDNMMSNFLHMQII